MAVESGAFREDDLRRLSEEIAANKLSAGNNAVISDGVRCSVVSRLDAIRAVAPIAWQPFIDRDSSGAQHIYIKPGYAIDVHNNRADYDVYMEWFAGIANIDGLHRIATDDALDPESGAIDERVLELDAGALAVPSRWDGCWDLGLASAITQDYRIYMVWDADFTHYSYAFSHDDFGGLSVIVEQHVMQVAYFKPYDANRIRGGVSWGGRSFVPGGLQAGVMYDADIFRMASVADDNFGNIWLNTRSLSSGYGDSFASIARLYAWLTGASLYGVQNKPNTLEHMEGNWCADADVCNSQALLRVARNFSTDDWTLELDYTPFEYIYVVPDRSVAYHAGWDANAGAVTYIEPYTERNASDNRVVRAAMVEPVAATYTITDEGKIAEAIDYNIIARYNMRDIMYIPLIGLLNVVFGPGCFMQHIMFYFDANDGSGTMDGGPEEQYYVGMADQEKWIGLKAALSDMPMAVNMLNMAAELVERMRDIRGEMFAYSTRVEELHWHDRIQAVSDGIDETSTNTLAEIDREITALEAFLS